MSVLTAIDYPPVVVSSLFSRHPLDNKGADLWVLKPVVRPQVSPGASNRPISSTRSSRQSKRRRGYGLGTENQDLPAFVVMSDGATKSGPPAYSSVFRGGESPILYLKNPEGLRSDSQRATLDFIRTMDRMQQRTRPDDSTLDARIASYELAYRMQSSAPEAVAVRPAGLCV